MKKTINLSFLLILVLNMKQK